MATGLKLRSQAAYFGASALLLLAAGLLTLHSDWPPSGWAKTGFSLGDVGKVLLIAAGAFAVSAVLYCLFPILMRREMNVRLIWVHFGGCWMGVFALFGLPLWVNLTLKTTPGGSGLEQSIESFFSGMDAFVYPIWIFLMAQLAVTGNVLWSLFRGNRVIAKAAR